MNRQDNSQKEQFSHLPSTWHKVSVNFVADVIDPHPSHRAPEEEPGGIPFAGIGDLNEIGEIQGKKARLVSPEIYVEHNKRYQITENTIGFGRVASIGKIIDFRAQIKKITISPTIALIEPKEKKVDKKFLVQALKSEDTQLQINLLLTGSTRSSLGISLLREIIIPYPPLPEQQKIATILTSVDTVIEKTRAQIDKLKHLKTGMMQQLLTQGIGHTEFKDTPIGRIPKEWDVGTLDSFGVGIFDGDRGKEYPKENDFYPSEFCLFLSAKNVTKNGFLFNEMAFITQEKDKLLRKGKLTRGDIVITTRGTIGNIAFYSPDVIFENIRINSGMAIIRNKSTALSSEFLHLLMNSPIITEQTELLAFGSAQPQLTISIIKNLIVPKPNLDEQKAITSAVSAVNKKLQLANKKLDLLTSTKKALMQDLLTGKVSVKT